MQATQAATRRLADRTRRDVEALWAQVADGDITPTRFTMLAAAVVARANVAGVNLADIGLAAEVTRQLRRPTRPLGLRPPAVALDQSRMAADIGRITTDNEAPGALLGDWAASETFLTAATAVQLGMAGHGFEGWTRRLSGLSCPRCTGWADGVVRPVSVSMIRHPGCDCIQQPTFASDAPVPPPGDTAAFSTFLSDLDADVARRSAVSASTVGRVDRRGFLITDT